MVKILASPQQQNRFIAVLASPFCCRICVSDSQSFQATLYRQYHEIAFQDIAGILNVKLLIQV